MIVRIHGRLIDIDETSAIIDRAGIAYQVMIPSYAYHELHALEGTEITLHTSEYLEGNAAGGNLVPRIIGFLHPEDRAFFLQFTTVKGLGVKKGLKALAAPVSQIASFIEHGDAAGLARLPGIGKRMAETIVAELKGKVVAHALVEDDVPEATKQEFNRDQVDAIEVLVAWGDTRNDAQRWISRAAQLHGDIDSPDEWVKAAYRIKSGTEG